MSPKPAIVLVHGSYHTPQVYASFLSALQAEGFETYCPQLPVSAPENLTPDPSNPTYDYDVKDFQSHPTQDQDAERIKTLLAHLIKEQGKEVLLLAHSSGGWTTHEAALPSFQKPTRAKEGKQGGIIGWFGISAFLIQPGESVWSTFAAAASSSSDAEEQETAKTWFAYHPSSNLTTIVEPEYWFFHDIPASEAEKWSKTLTACPQLQTPLTNDAYPTLPGAYVVCEEDRVLLPDYQIGMIKGAEARGGRKIVQYRVKGGHEAFLSKAGDIVDAVVDFIWKCT
ncbi:Alpha/Beta hydrolase protein [Lophiotrema nucula]|uniref:Alpha/Beta hydrolase protein n=1 Tax=Lophiotrema nucula TaxID=690887 RepID=A0A6A5YP33_9PLEO|nr:Alpha/Beta hydrolase protein [Lophiotrema nucula]